MATESLTREVIVLEKRPAAADGWERLTLFSSEDGVIAAMARVSKRARSEPPLDLFDEASVILESSNQGHSWFLKEARLQTRRPEMGQSYARLAAASALARLAARNPVGDDSRAQMFALLHSAFTAFANANRPDVVAFKAFYRFARDEGYPVKEDWRWGLIAADRDQVDALLDRPVSETTALPDVVTRLHQRLIDYLRNATDLEVD